MRAPRCKPTARFAALVSSGGGGFGHQRWRRGNLPEQQDRASQAHRREDDRGSERCLEPLGERRQPIRPAGEREAHHGHRPKAKPGHDRLPARGPDDRHHGHHCPEPELERRVAEHPLVELELLRQTEVAKDGGVQEGRDRGDSAVA
jgi:hypothetical protein